MVYMWANFDVNFRNRASGNVAVVCISIFLFISLFVRIFFQRIDKYLPEPQPKSKDMSIKMLSTKTASQVLAPIDIDKDKRDEDAEDLTEGIEIVFSNNE